MQSMLNEWGALIVRVCLSALFIISGAQMLMNFSGTTMFMGSLFPMGTLVAVVVIAVKLGGGLSVLLGYKAKWGAWALIVFTALTIVLVHNNMAELVQALKNLALIGGLLTVAMHGAGGKSLEGRSTQPVM